MVNLVIELVEMIVLGSGYQSTCVFACWDVPYLRKAFRCGEFFETFFLEFSNSEYYRELMQALDGVISELTSMASFPQGLAHLSSTTLTKAIKLAVEQLLRGLPLRKEHLRAVVVTTAETDLCCISNAEDDILSQISSARPLSQLFANDSIDLLQSRVLHITFLKIKTAFRVDKIVTANLPKFAKGLAIHKGKMLQNKGLVRLDSIKPTGEI
ncbi:hypothetical protein MLD38_029727 [Melastoma candidum]|uniref:Uncharacterized protein n=1 Tax=Melastoma candidum TaxID=119954 RepID=A0ACB9N4L1_9MYRT|nr:hypothetical protein MLD38_029727 [Melastoma candidum]